MHEAMLLLLLYQAVCVSLLLPAWGTPRLKWLKAYHQSPSQQKVILGHQVRLRGFSQSLKNIMHESMARNYDLEWVAEKLRGRSNMVILDIGAHLGLSSVVLAKMFPSATIYSFEPSPRTYEFLLWNLRANQVTNVRAHNAAFTADGRNVTMFLNPKHSAQNNVYGAYNHKGVPTQMNQFDLPSATLADVQQAYNFSAIDLLKIDCEGCEFEVISNISHQGWAAANHRSPPIIGEIHPAVPPPGTTEDQYLSTLLALCDQRGRYWGKGVEHCASSTGRLQFKSRKMAQMYISTLQVVGQSRLAPGETLPHMTLPR